MLLVFLGTGSGTYHSHTNSQNLICAKWNRRKFDVFPSDIWPFRQIVLHNRSIYLKTDILCCVVLFSRNFVPFLTHNYNNFSTLRCYCFLWSTRIEWKFNIQYLPKEVKFVQYSWSRHFECDTVSNTLCLNYKHNLTKWGGYLEIETEIWHTFTQV